MTSHTSAACIALSAQSGLHSGLWLTPQLCNDLRCWPVRGMLWLHLADGRICVLKPVAEHVQPPAAELAGLVQRLLDDPADTVLHLDTEITRYHILTAAPATPLRLERLRLPELAGDFERGLDGSLLELLRRLERPGWRWMTAANYNRLLRAPRRAEHMQALQRFPPLVAPLLLDGLHDFNLKRGFAGHRRTDEDEGTVDLVVAALEQGRDLTGALARHYGLSRAIVRSPLCADAWEHTTLDVLRDLDALPAQRRPVDLATLEAFAPAHKALRRILHHDPYHPAPGDLLCAIFRNGWAETWRDCQPVAHDLAIAAADLRDCLREVARAARAQSVHHISTTRLLHHWLRQRGLRRALDISQRWHAQLHQQPAADWRRRSNATLPSEVPAVLGTLREHGAQASEICHYAALVREGEEMQHCVAAYWPRCVAGTRIFHLTLADGQRATAEYRPIARDNDCTYVLEQLRGKANVAASAAMQTWAGRVAIRLNHPGRAVARRTALQLKVEPGSANGGMPEPLADTRLQRELNRVLHHMGLSPEPKRAAHVVLRAPIAGFQYHAGPELEAKLARDDTLTLVPEPHNPHDCHAVRIDWHGHTLGYVPRHAAPPIATALATGQALRATLSSVEPDYPVWLRAFFLVEEGCAGR